MIDHEDDKIPDAILALVLKTPNGERQNMGSVLHQEALQCAINMAELLGESVRAVAGTLGKESITFRAELTEHGTVALVHTTGHDFAKSVRRWADRYAWRQAGSPKKGKDLSRGTFTSRDEVGT